MQAWKKTSAYLRSHSWYADTLGLDYESLRLPQFIREIQVRLQDPENWKSKPLELVPAPKNQRWAYHNEKWEPREKNIDRKLRPLAHLDLQDQVVATAIMLCLADRVETAMGDPRLPINKAENRRQVLAYGHRLFCDLNDNNELVHHWGSAKLYRQFFQDYQTFLERPKVVAKSLQNEGNYDIAIIQSDLSKFYDRVRPELLHKKLCKFKYNFNEDAFFNLAERVFDWRWSDRRRADRYAKDHKISNFGLVALPQGLVTAGFYANVVLNDLDIALREGMGQTLPDSEMVLEDACYYVDDFRIVLKIPKNMQEDDVKSKSIEWLQVLLDRHVSGLKISEDKTVVTVEGRDKRFLVMQSREANRIQSQVSDTFDMLHGTELIAAIEGFFHTQQRYSTELDPEKKDDSGLLVGVPDMRDDTAARFAAGKFRRTFRSLRPLLADEPEPRAPDTEDDEATLPQQLVLTKTQLDQRAKFFAALLIEEWIRNPGNVRLLRIALDMYPDCEFLDQILKILRPGWESTSFRKAKREIRIYCLAELFRAGATETGFVQEDESLPSGISTDEYHNRLIKEAQELAQAYLDTKAPGSRFPWYLMQQVFLYLAARNAIPENMAAKKARGGKLLSQYWKLAQFISGEVPTTLEQRSIFLVIAKTGYGISGFDFLRSKARLSEKFLSEVDRISPPVARELWQHFRNNASEQMIHTAQRLGLENQVATASEMTVADVSGQPINPFYEEENLLEMAFWLLSKPESFKDIVTPWNVRCAVEKYSGYEFGKIKTEDFDFTKVGSRATHLFKPPDWCETDEERQKIQIGLLLRYALRGSTDFYNNFSSKKPSRGLRYNKPISHWEQQRYSSFQGRDAFGPPWLPISSFTEDLLFQLLRWPGSGVLKPHPPVDDLLKQVEKRLVQLRKWRGKVTSATFLEQKAPYPSSEPKQSWVRPLRIGIVQSLIPNFDDYSQHLNDPELINDHNLRTRQRAHLSAIMEGVAQMLRVRDTHRKQIRNDKRVIDLLIFPELAIHPHDINTRILPFVRKHRCLALFGQVYHQRDHMPNSPLINSCLWMIPEWSKSEGLQIRRIEQGKLNLAVRESGFTPQPIGFRPTQWLIEYQWHRDVEKHRPLILSASVCYDATDLALAADLRSRSDLYIICALNRDVGTFDRMSEGLHYHMFQGVIVVNNGEYGGSSFFMPFKDTFHRQVFHLHGQPQVSIAFAEISPQKLIERPIPSNSFPEGSWKTPPAGWGNHE
jgi:hypothetical protein